MPISIKDPDTDAKIRDLAALTGESITVAVRTAIEQRLRRESARRRAGGLDRAVHPSSPGLPAAPSGSTSHIRPLNTHYPLKPRVEW